MWSSTYRPENVIVYNLRCGNDHSFEGWFQNIAAFETQEGHGKLMCPLCSSRKVSRAPMAPSISVRSRGEVEVVPSAPAPAPVAEASPAPDELTAELRKMRQVMSSLRKFVEHNADYVGPSFPEEARKIHYGESEQRQIYGEASPAEVAGLLDEGIEIAPLPPDLDRTN